MWRTPAPEPPWVSQEWEDLCCLCSEPGEVDDQLVETTWGLMHAACADSHEESYD